MTDLMPDDPSDELLDRGRLQPPEPRMVTTNEHHMQINPEGQQTA